MSEDYEVRSAPTPLACLSAVPFVPTPLVVSSVSDKKVVQSTSQDNQDKEFEEWSIQDKINFVLSWINFYVAGMYNYPDNDTKVRYGLSKLEEQVFNDPNPCMSSTEFITLVKEEHRRNQKIHPELSYIYNLDDEPVVPDVSASSPLAASSPLGEDEVVPDVSASSPMAASSPLALDE